MNRSWTASHKEELINAWGDRCLLCLPSAPKEKVVWHHLIEKVEGGEDSIENVIPLCHKHHMIIHHRNASRAKVYKDFHSTGRPRIPGNDEIYEKFIHAEITGKEASVALGYSNASHICDSGNYKNYLARMGITEIRREPYKCWIKYKDGREEKWRHGLKVK